MGRIDYGICFRLLVADERSVRRICAINAWLPSRLLEDFIAAKKCQVHACCPGSFNSGPLSARPIFVVPNGQENLVLLDQRAVPVRVHAREITDVVSVCLKPSKHWVLRSKKPGVQIRNVERPVVTDFVSAASRVSGVQAISAIVVVRVPI